MNLTFSFVVPIGPNYDPRLKQTLRSIVGQGVPINLAVCDASNSDDCKADLAPYSEVIDYVRHGPDHGQSAAINEGWRNVEGDIYAWLNVDDCLAPGALKEVNDVFVQNPDVDVVFGQSYITQENRVIGLHSVVRPMGRDIFSSNIVSQPSCFVRRKALFDVGLLAENLHYTMDWDLWTRLFDTGANFRYVPRVFSSVAWDQTTKTASLNLDRYREIYHLRRRYSGWFLSIRTTMSFLLEHLSQYGVGRRIFLTALNMIRKKNKVPVQNWALNAESASVRPCHDKMVLPIFHFDNVVVNALHLEFGTAAQRRFQLGKMEPVTSHDKVVKILVTLPLGTNQVLTIEDADAPHITLRSILYLNT